MALHDLPEVDNNVVPPNPNTATGRSWTALETLAEVSRQVIVSEKQDDGTFRNVPNDQLYQHRFEVKEQWTPENPPLTYEASLQRKKRKPQRVVLPGTY